METHKVCFSEDYTAKFKDLSGKIPNVNLLQSIRTGLDLRGDAGRATATGAGSCRQRANRCRLTRHTIAAVAVHLPEWPLPPTALKKKEG